MAQSKVKADLPIEALLKEKRKFPPPKAFVNNAVMNRKAIYAEASRNPVRFWEQRAKELDWFKPWRKALEWKPPYAKWFVGGKLNVSYNCLDRHVAGPRRTKAALIWEGEPGDTRTLTYWDLYREVNRFASAPPTTWSLADSRPTPFASESATPSRGSWSRRTVGTAGVGSSRSRRTRTRRC